MAQSDVLSLFNMQTPEQLRQDYLDKNMISPGQMGSQGLLQQVVSQMSNAGSMIGSAGGQLLGGKVAGEVEAAGIQQVMKDAAGRQFKNDSERYSFVAEGLDKLGLNKQAMLARKEANKSQLEGLQLAEAIRKGELPLTKDFKFQRKVVDPTTKAVTWGTVTVTKVWNKDTNSYEFPSDVDQSSLSNGVEVVKPLTPEEQHSLKTKQDSVAEFARREALKSKESKWSPAPNIRTTDANSEVNAADPEGQVFAQSFASSPQEAPAKVFEPIRPSNQYEGRVNQLPAAQSKAIQQQLRKLQSTDIAAYWRMRQELEKKGIDVKALTENHIQ